MGAPRKVHDTPVGRAARRRRLDRFFFGLGTAASVWLAVVLITSDLRLSWGSVVALILVWAVLAYLTLPRLNRILTTIYVPDYFIGRTRTSDGLLGDPLNLAFRGTGEQVSTAMTKAGWIPADPVTLRSSIKIIVSVLARRPYDRAPVSPLLLFNRQQDVAYQQEVDGNASQRHHVRLWRTPDGWPLPGGTRVDWLAAGTFDRAVGLSLFTLQVTHKIDADIDVERDHIIETVQAAEPAATVEVLHDFTTSYHSRNGGGDSIHTDGNLPIVDVSGVTAATGASDLRPTPPTGVPLQVWFPALVNLIGAPLVVWGLLREWPADAAHRWGSVAEIAFTLTTALLALLLVIRRNNTARQVLLGVAAFTVVTHFSAYAVAESDDVRSAAVLAATLAIFVLIALSSPVATAWTSRRAPDADTNAH